MKKNLVLHSDTTILKHIEIYEAYTDLCAEVREMYPEVADYVARSYYYGILSRRFKLTPNYVCAIVCDVMNNKEHFTRLGLIAKMNLEQDQ